ncbi:MAG TPA: hypothetical protein VKA86_00745 [Candidatus Krumholzibacteria bacterium]|nr:hypothetical protein [Candidatus Krumholzibacteria bacterium]
MTDDIIPLDRYRRANTVTLQGALTELDISVEEHPGRRWNALLWAHPDGRILAHTVIPADVPLDQPPHGADADRALDVARGSLREALAELLDDEQSPPVRASIVVGDPSLVGLARSVRADIACTIGPTPEAQRAGDSLAAWMGGEPGAEGPDLSATMPPRVPELDDNLRQRFANSMQWLLDADPWGTVDPAFHLIGVECPAVGLPDAIAHLVRGPDGSVGLMLFASMAAWRLSQSVADDTDERPGLEHFPSHAVVNTFGPADLDTGLADQLAADGWTTRDGRYFLPMANLRGEGPAACSEQQVRQLDLLASTLAQMTEQHLRGATFSGLHGHVAEFEIAEAGAEPLLLELSAPARALRGAREFDDYGSGLSLRALGREYLSHRSKTVSLATVDKDRAALTDLFETIDLTWRHTLPDDAGPASAILGCETLAAGIADHVRMTMFVPLPNWRNRIQNGRRALRGFVKWLVREKALYANAAPYLLVPVDLAHEDGSRCIRAVQQLFAAVEATRPDEAVEETPEVGDVDLPWGSGYEYSVQRFERDRLWLRDTSDRTGSPIRLPGHDLSRTSLRRGDVLIARVGRAVGGKGKGQRRLLEIHQVIREELSTWS